LISGGNCPTTPESGPQMALTDTAIKNTKPGTKPLRVFDRDGLYLEVSPSGGKWWRFKYCYARKEKRLSLGVYPDVDLKKARKRTSGARELPADGVDPGQYRKAAKATREERSANSFEGIAREWVDKQMATWPKNYGTRILARFDNDASSRG
jgi:Arm DNA-binding domain